MAKRGMGRGLSAILPESAADADLRELPLDAIKPNPSQPRTRFDSGSIAELARSIEVAGVIQPVIVRPLDDGSYELIAGERRWRAAQEAGLDRLPALVRDQGETERLQTALIENMAREDLNPIDEARACAALVEDLGLSKEEIARRLGRTRPSISNLIRILDLPDEAIGLLADGELSEGHGRAILQARGQDARRRLARGAAEYGWSVRETERKAKQSSGKRKPARRRGGSSADERDAIAGAEDALEAAIGHDVRVRVAGSGIKAELVFDDVDELIALARRLARR